MQSPLGKHQPSTASTARPLLKARVGRHLWLPRTQWGPSVPHIQVVPWKFAFFWTPIALAPTLLGHGEYPTLKLRGSLRTKGSWCLLLFFLFSRKGRPDQTSWLHRLSVSMGWPDTENLLGNKNEALLGSVHSPPHPVVIETISRMRHLMTFSPRNPTITCPVDTNPLFKSNAAPRA